VADTAPLLSHNLTTAPTSTLFSTFKQPSFLTKKLNSAKMTLKPVEVAEAIEKKIASRPNPEELVNKNVLKGETV
jgi:hypothetical protein